MSDIHPESDLIQRLRRLEKSQARYRLAFMVTAAIAAILCMMGAGRSVEDVIQAKSFEVVDDNAKVLARFSSADGKGEFRTFRADGNPLVSVFSSKDDSGRVEVYNAGGKPALSLSTSATGAGSLIVRNSAGARVLHLGGSTSHHGGLWIYNADGKLIASITAGTKTPDGVAETFDASGTRTGRLP